VTRAREDEARRLDEADASLLDVVDHVLTKGVVLAGDLTMGVAGVDLIYARLSTLLCAADRVLPPPGAAGPAGRRRGPAVLDPTGSTPRLPPPGRLPAALPPAAAPSPGARPASPPRQGRRGRPAAGAVGRARGRSLARPRARPAGRGTRRRALVDEQVAELESFRAELERQARAPSARRWNADPQEVQRSVARLVLSVVEFLRQLMERQAIRRMQAGTLTPDETEAVGLALMRLEETLRDLASRFGLAPEELNLDLGPLGRLV
jgi:hypothetical protein